MIIYNEIRDNTFENCSYRNREGIISFGGQDDLYCSTLKRCYVRAREGEDTLFQINADNSSFFNLVEMAIIPIEEYNRLKRIEEKDNGAKLV